MSGYRRSKKLIKPGFQLTIIGAFMGLTVVALMLQFLFLGGRLMSIANHLEGSGGELASELPRTMVEVFLVSMCVLLPVIFALGVMMTFRIAGPVYRFESFLAAVARGEQKEPCKLRKGDALQSLCDQINLATEPLRSQVEVEVEVDDAEDTSEHNLRAVV